MSEDRDTGEIELELRFFANFRSAVGQKELTRRYE